MTQQRRQGGFSLVELMLVVGVSSIVGVTFFGVMYTQNLAYLERLDELDAHGNARAAMNVLRRYVHAARWGMVSNPNGGGTVALGKCYNSTNPLISQGSCNNLASDGGADRLRVVYIVNDSSYVGAQPYCSTCNCANYGPGAAANANYIHVNTNPSPIFAPATLAAIGGNCNGANPNFYPAAADVVLINSDVSSCDSCGHCYSVTPLEGGSLSCAPGSYAPNFNFGRAVVADFFIANIQNRPMLMLRTDPRTAIASAYVVAYDIEDLQVSYGIDTTEPADRAVDVWCDDPRTSADGGNGTCDTHSQLGTAWSSTYQYNRIVAVQVTIRVRTGTTRPGLQPYPLNANYLVANPVPNRNDGYQRWIYTSTISARNDDVWPTGY